MSYTLRPACALSLLAGCVLLAQCSRQLHAQALMHPAAFASMDGATATVNPLGDPVNEDLASDGDESNEEEDILDMDLDQLTQTSVGSNAMEGSTLNDVVSSVSRSETPIARTPSAVYVITQDMIRRSGARNIMEVLRMAPGVHVARVSATEWAISIRGFTGIYADKLLVQIDGRAIYGPTFGGVFWEQHLTPLHDIERIEVVRGPGATVWGSNAVNGVINIVTKDTADTVGAYAEAGGGNEHRSFSAGRVGGRMGSSATYRVYGAHTEVDPGGPLVPGLTASRRGAQAGFRLDWNASCQDKVTFQGDFSNSQVGVGSPLTVAADDSAGNFLARWTREIDPDTEFSVQTYYDYFHKDYEDGSVRFDTLGLNTFDLDSQLHCVRGVHDTVCGFGFRNYESNSTVAPTTLFQFAPPNEQFDIISYFVQDTITLSEDLLFLTMGCKFEHNDFVGFVYQPAVKMAMTPDDKTSLWASVSKSVRTPSLANRSILVNAPIPGGQILNNIASPDLGQEHAMTYELGLRRQPTPEFYWEVATYFTRYDDLVRTNVVGVSFPVLTVQADNTASSDTYGGELLATYELDPACRLRGWWSFFREARREGAAPTLDLFNSTGTCPRNQAYLGVSTDLTRRMTCDLGLRYVESLSVSQQAFHVPSYAAMDLRLAWQLDNGMEIAVVGQNLFDGSHLELKEPTGFATESLVQDSVFGVVSWEY